MNVALTLLLLSAAVNCQLTPPIAPAPIVPPEKVVDLGRCQKFVVEAQTKMSFDGDETQIIRGDIGISPGISITGKYKLYAGNKHVNDEDAQACTTAMQAAYTQAQKQACTKTFPEPDLSGKTLEPGVYCSLTGTLSITTGTLTLNALGNPDAEWVFRTDSTLVLASGTEVKLDKGAKAENVYWAVGSSATLGSTAKMVGNILALASITFNAGTNLVGRGLAQAAVTFASASNLENPPPTIIGIPPVPTVSPVPTTPPAVAMK